MKKMIIGIGGVLGTLIIVLIILGFIFNKGGGLQGLFNGVLTAVNTSWALFATGDATNGEINGNTILIPYLGDTAATEQEYNDGNANLAKAQAGLLEDNS